MIIRKKNLNKMSGVDEQPVEQDYDENIQDDISASYEYEQNLPENNNGGISYIEEQSPNINSENSETAESSSYIISDENVERDEVINKESSDIQKSKQKLKVVNRQKLNHSTKSAPAPTPTPEPQIQDEEINLFDLDNIDFSQRQERRRGDRRRGFRRVDDRNLVSRAREEADAIRESALKEGYEEGLEKAKSDIEELNNSLNQFMSAKQEVFEYIAPDILEISVDIAKKIIKQEISQDPQILFNTIVDVLKTLSKEEAKVTLRVNPAEVNNIKQAVPELLELAGIDTKVVVLADEEVSEGGCLVTTTNGIVDATIETRIAVVSKALREL